MEFFMEATYVLTLNLNKRPRIIEIIEDYETVETIFFSLRFILTYRFFLTKNSKSILISIVFFLLFELVKK